MVWIAWGALHSVLITPAVRRCLALRLGPRDRFYRIGFNAVAVGTFVLAYAYTRWVGGPTVFDWWGAAGPVSAVALALAAVLLVAPLSDYDLGVFLGTRGLRGSSSGLTESGGFARRGIHALVRHPWYTATFLILWAGNHTAAGLVMSTVLSLYLVVGTLFEERKLVREFGEVYRNYQREVSMFVPVK